MSLLKSKAFQKKSEEPAAEERNLAVAYGVQRKNRQRSAQSLTAANVFGPDEERPSSIAKAILAKRKAAVPVETDPAEDLEFDMLDEEPAFQVPEAKEPASVEPRSIVAKIRGRMRMNQGK